MQVFELEDEFKEKNLQNLQKKTAKMRNFAQQQIDLIVEEMFSKYAINSKGYEVKTTDGFPILIKDYKKLLELKKEYEIHDFPWELSKKQIDDILNPTEPEKEESKTQVSQNGKEKSREEKENWDIDF